LEATGTGFPMSKHHHHPHEGHSAGDAPGYGRKPLHHNPFFWVAGFFILVALIGFIVEGSGMLRSTPVPVQAPAPASIDK
jgi:hypothetical protein